MFLTFTKNEFINKFNEEGFGNTFLLETKNINISKLISRYHLYRVFEELWSTKQQHCYYARFENTLTTLLTFNDNNRDVAIFYDLLKQIQGVYGEFFFSQKSLSNIQSDIHFSEWSFDKNYRLVPTVDDWKRVVQLEDGLTFENYPSPDVDVSNSKKNKYVVCRHFSDPKVGWALSNASCLIVTLSSHHTWFTRWMVPFVHYFPGDDETKVIQWLMENDSAAERVANNGFLLYQEKMKKNHVVETMQSVLRQNNYTCPPFKFKIDTLPNIPDFSVSWCGTQSPTENSESIQSLSQSDRQACLIQTMILFQQLQWHHCAYLSRFKLWINNTPARLELRDMHDHFLNMKHTVYIQIEGTVFYVQENRTNYQEILHNYQDILNCFGIDWTRDLQCFKPTFKQCLHYFYFKTNHWLPSQVYTRRHPRPVRRLKPLTKIMAHPLPFDNNSNKLVIYRQFQMYSPALKGEYSQEFHSILKNKTFDDVTFDIIDFDFYDWWQLQYDETVPIPKVNVANDALHQRLIMELFHVILPKDKKKFLSMFQSLMDLDKVIYSIRYAQLKTISVEQ